jgi:class 3 adenylate cyclase/tetratricopeptide (TPR) repeat protein
MFADLRGSTGLAEQHDVEDVRELLRWFTHAAIAAIEAYGGVINDLAGDGVLGLFGAPVAREDDPERAVRAGLAFQREMATVRRRALSEMGFPDVAARVGIETGRVVAGLVGSGGRIEYGVTGDAVNVAARLQSLAPPGGVLVGPRTVSEVGGRVAWGESLRLELKGRAAPVEARLALSPEVEDATTAPTGLGRRSELASVAAVVGELEAGRGSVVLVSGPPGIGKTWLVSSGAAAATHAGAHEWRIGCAPWDQDSPFAAVAELLERAGVARSAGSGEPGVHRRRVLLALRNLAMAALEQGPLCVVAEDLHWADPSTLDTITVLAEVARTSPLLLLASTRDLGALPPALVDRRLEYISLEPLSEEDAHGLLDELVRPVALPADLTRRVLAAAAGNPLYLHEFVRSWSDAGLLGAGTDELARSAAARAGIPTSLERLVLSRLDLLDNQARDALSGVSVLSGDFGVDLARAVLEEHTDSDRGVPALLDELVGRDHLVGRGTRYAFRHDLVREVAEASLVRGRRRELNRRAATAVERFGGDSATGVLALYWERAGEPAKAFVHHVRAEEAAVAVSALVEALAHVDAACRLGAELSVDEALAIELLVRRAGLRNRTGDARGARTDAERALVEGRGLGRDDLLQRAFEELSMALEGAVDYEASVQAQHKALELAQLRDDLAGQVRAHARLAIHAVNRLVLAEAGEHARLASRLAEREDDASTIAPALDAAKQVALQLGDADRVESLAARLSDLNHAGGDMWREQFVKLECGLVAAEQARWDVAESLFADGLALNREVGDVGNEPLFLIELSWLARSRGRFVDALVLAERASRSARHRGHVEWQAYAQMRLAQTYLEIGDWSRAEQAARSASQGARTAGARVHEVPAHAVLARALHELGRAPEATEALARCGSLLAEVTVPSGSSFLYGWEAYAAVALLTGLGGHIREGLETVRPILLSAVRSRYHVAASTLYLVQARLLLEGGELMRARRSAADAAALAVDHDIPGIRWRADAALARLASGMTERAAHSDAVRTQTDALLENIDKPRGAPFEALRRTAIGDLRWP